MGVVQRCCWVIVIGALTVGCTQPPPQFRENLLAVTEVELVDEHREQIQSVLIELFGTPNEPRVPDVPLGAQLDEDLLAMAAGPAGYVVLDDGEERLQRGLFRQHCASCHGVTGDGAGLAAAILAPYPRDFRPGVFKFKSTYLAARPTDGDLRRAIVHGIPGTAMPSFALLTDEQVDALVEYVKYLAIRGEVERELIATIGDEFDFEPGSNTTDDPLDPGQDAGDQALVAGIVADVGTSWEQARLQVVTPDPNMVLSDNRSVAEVAKSANEGLELYLSARAKCTDCHGQPGGKVIAKDYDDWNAAVVDFEEKTATLAASITRRKGQLSNLTPAQRRRAEQQIARDDQRLRRRREVEWQLLEPQLDRPRSLASGVFHGGSEPTDLFRRVHQGIAGTPMPGHGSPRPGVEGAISDAEIWQLVDFLRSQRSENSL